MSKIYLNDLSSVDKQRFQHQELFTTIQNIRVSMSIIALGILAFETIQYFILPSGIKSNCTNFTISMFLSYVLSYICYYFAVLRNYERNDKKIIISRYVLLFASVFIFSGGLIYAFSQSFGEAQMETRDSNNMLINIINEKSEIWLVFFIDMVLPLWYLKLIIPIAIWIGTVIQYYRYDLDQKEILWTRFGFALFYLVCISAVKAYTQWRSFLKRLNNEIWYDVQTSIMNKLPDAIGVIDHEYKVAYSNNSFQLLCNNNINDLGQRITQLKKQYPLIPDKSVHDPNEPVRIRLISDETKQNFIHEDIKNQDPYNLADTFGNLAELFEEMMTYVVTGGTNADEYIVFTGKYKNLENSTEDPRTFEIKISPIANHKKVIIILNDITQREKVVSLEEVNQYKDKLLATVSHDLRAPINGTITFIENTLEYDSVPREIKKKYLIPAQRCCRFLLHLVNDILDFSQINAQKLRMSFESLPIVETIKNCHELLDVQATHKKLNFPLVIDRDIPHTFTTDHNRLPQIIINLLTNALKFTSKGEVKLTASLVEKGIIEIKVSDTGIGMKEEDQAKLFKEFTRISYEQANMNTRGVGLGLVIANQLAKMLGPSRESEQGIKVSSAYGQGSTFSFLIKDKSMIRERSLKEELKVKLTSLAYIAFDPQARVRSKEKIHYYGSPKTGEYTPSDYNSTIHLPPLAKFSVRHPSVRAMMMKDVGSRLTQLNLHGKVLVVDDDAFNILAIESQLKRYGLTVDSAYNGQEAIDKLLKSQTEKEEPKAKITDSSEDLSSDEESEDMKYDLIFMDCEMPIMNGLDSAKTLTKMMKNGQIDAIPIIGCTAHRDRDNTIKCYESGMVEVLLKPVTREKIKECLKSYLDLEPWH